MNLGYYIKRTLSECNTLKEHNNVSLHGVQDHSKARTLPSLTALRFIILKRAVHSCFYTASSGNVTQNETH